MAGSLKGRIIRKTEDLIEDLAAKYGLRESGIVAKEAAVLEEKFGRRLDPSETEHLVKQAADKQPATASVPDTGEAERAIDLSGPVADATVGTTGSAPKRISTSFAAPETATPKDLDMTGPLGGGGAALDAAVVSATPTEKAIAEGINARPKVTEGKLSGKLLGAGATASTAATGLALANMPGEVSKTGAPDAKSAFAENENRAKYQAAKEADNAVSAAEEKVRGQRRTLEQNGVPAAEIESRLADQNAKLEELRSAAKSANEAAHGPATAALKSDPGAESAYVAIGGDPAAVEKAKAEGTPPPPPKPEDQPKSAAETENEKVDPTKPPKIPPPKLGTATGISTPQQFKTNLENATTALSNFESKNKTAELGDNEKQFIKDWDTRRSQLQAEYEKRKDHIEWAQAAEIFGKALARIGAGIYGLNTGVNVAGANFDPSDWTSRYDIAFKEYSKELDNAEKDYGAKKDLLTAIRKEWQDYKEGKAKAGTELATAEQRTAESRQRAGEALKGREFDVWKVQQEQAVEAWKAKIATDEKKAKEAAKLDPAQEQMVKTWGRTVDEAVKSRTELPGNIAAYTAALNKNDKVGQRAARSAFLNNAGQVLSAETISAARKAAENWAGGVDEEDYATELLKAAQSEKNFKPYPELDTFLKQAGAPANTAAKVRGETPAPAKPSAAAEPVGSPRTLPDGTKMVKTAAGWVKQ